MSQQKDLVSADEFLYTESSTRVIDLTALYHTLEQHMDSLGNAAGQLIQDLTGDRKRISVSDPDGLETIDLTGSIVPHLQEKQRIRSRIKSNKLILRELLNAVQKLTTNSIVRLIDDESPNYRLPPWTMNAMGDISVIIESSKQFLELFFEPTSRRQDNPLFEGLHFEPVHNEIIYRCRNAFKSILTAIRQDTDNLNALKEIRNFVTYDLQLAPGRHGTRTSSAYVPEKVDPVHHRDVPDEDEMKKIIRRAGCIVVDLLESHSELYSKESKVLEVGDDLPDDWNALMRINEELLDPKFDPPPIDDIKVAKSGDFYIPPNLAKYGNDVKNEINQISHRGRVASLTKCISDLLQTVLCSWNRILPLGGCSSEQEPPEKTPMKNQIFFDMIEFLVSKSIARASVARDLPCGFSKIPSGPPPEPKNRHIPIESLTEDNVQSKPSSQPELSLEFATAECTVSPELLSTWLEYLTEVDPNIGDSDIEMEHNKGRDVEIDFAFSPPAADLYIQRPKHPHSKVSRMMETALDDVLEGIELPDDEKRELFAFELPITKKNPLCEHWKLTGTIDKPQWEYVSKGPIQDMQQLQRFRVDCSDLPARETSYQIQATSSVFKSRTTSS
eukprot:GHVH01003967.1.p1 GENE.GHVH01003967.1~~GHVH01003967.1.p1  ORF type:complete len:615 (+),score=93.61 GHVH01003967.1:503-2347(+)